MSNIDIYTSLTLHHLRGDELRADAARARLARVARGGDSLENTHWWSRIGRRHRGAATRAPALS